MAISSGYSAEDLARLGPDALTRRRMLAEALLAKSAGQRKIEHPLQGAAQMAEALINGLRVRKLDQAETEGMKSGESAWSSLFGGSNSSAPSAAMPAATGAGQELAATSPSGSKPLDMSGNEVFGQFIDTVKQGGVQNPYALSAIAATGKAESGFDPKNATRTWSDPSESGQPGTAGGIMSWRGPRYQALAATGDLSPAGQAKFFLQENPQLIQALNNAKSVEEAQGLMNNAWKFAGYDRPGGEASRRLQLASSFLPTFQNREVASASPQAAMEAVAPASGYVDPMVSAPNSQPQQMAAIPPAGGMPPLEPPRTIGTPPVPPNAPPPQQLAQALTGNSAPLQQRGPSVQDLAKILSNPWVSDDKKKIAQVLLGKKLEEDDPLRKLQIEKGQLEIEKMRTPKEDVPESVKALDLRAQRAGLKPGTKEYNDFMTTGGSKGVTVDARQMGNIPPGYQVQYDEQGRPAAMMPIPGSPAAREAEAASRQADQRKAGTTTSANVVTQDIDRAFQAMEGATLPTTGLVGDFLSNIPGTAARDVRGLVDTIKANATFDKLQQMRESSPTGGALGAVSDTENRLLAAAIGNLEQSQGDQQFRDNLARVQNIYLDIIHGKDNGPPRRPLSFDKNPEEEVPLDDLLKKYGG